MFMIWFDQSSIFNLKSIHFTHSSSSPSSSSNHFWFVTCCVIAIVDTNAIYLSSSSSSSDFFFASKKNFFLLFPITFTIDRYTCCKEQKKWAFLVHFGMEFIFFRCLQFSQFNLSIWNCHHFYCFWSFCLFDNFISFFFRSKDHNLW